MMNYAQVLEQIEQLKIGKMNLKNFTYKRILYIPEGYSYDFVGEYIEAILKEHKFSVGRLTSFAMKSPVGHILFNGKTISQKDFAKYGESVLGRCITKMEVIQNIAFEMFTDKNVDVVILPCDEKADFEAYKEIYMSTPVAQQEDKAKEIVVEFLKKEGIELMEKLTQKALEKCKGEGRFELLKKKPYFILDGACDASSVKLLMAKLQNTYPNNPYIFIVGVMKDGYEEIVKESALMPWQIITVTPFECQNALPAIELAEEYGKLNPNITNVSGIEEAIEITSILANKETVVVCFGTTAILSGCRDVVMKEH